MSGLSIHEKRQLAEQLAREQLSKSGQYRFGIPQSVLNAKANEFMRLSDKEIQQKFNEYFQSTGLNAKPKDLWDSMGLNLEQKKKAEAHMKGLQKQINKKYMRPASSNKKKTGAKQAKNILPNDVKKEIRQFMVALLKQAFNQKSEEFRNYLLNNKGGFAEGAMELHDLGSAFADKLTEIGIVVDRGDTRAEIREKLIKKQAEIDVLESYIGDEKSFNELFQKYFNEDFDYRSTFDYICASSEFTTQDSAKKIEKFNKKIDGLTKTNLKSADDYMGNASGAGGLMDLAFNVALMYVSGGSSAIGKYAQMTAKGGTELAENAITKVAGKKLAQSNAGQAMSQGVGIVAAQTTSAGLNAVAFQGTKTAELAGETLATGEIDREKAKNIVASAEGLFKFGYVGGAISGPLGMQVKGLTTKLLNSKPIINQILTKGITSRPAPLTSVLKDISEHSEAIGEVLKFGTEFGINAGYMAYDEGVSYTDAMKNLAQMDGVSKMVIAMLGGKNLEFLTPKKVQQIKTDLAGYKVNIAIYEGQKVYSVKDAKGKETVLATPEELFMFILDKEAQSVGVKAEHSNADNTPQQNAQGAREQGGVRASNTEKNFDKMTARLKNGHVNYTLSTTEDGRNLVKIENSTKLFTANRFDYYEFDKDGNLVKSQTQISEASAKEMFTDFKNAQARNIRNRGGRLNAGVPVMDMAEGIEANVTSRNVRNEVGNANNILDKVFDNTTIEQTKAIITKYCSENGLVTDDILSIFNKYTKDLDDASVERLLELASENKINLFSSQKEKMFLSFKRHCNEHSLSVNPKGILNYLKEGDEETAQFLKELLTLEKQGKIKPKNINEMLKLYTYDDDFNSFTEQCRLLAQKLQNGEILDAQIRDAIFFIENEMPLEILNPKNISKYTKDDLREWSLMIQDANCKGLATETFNAINRELASLVKINKVPVNISQNFSSQFNSIMNILGNNNFSIEKLAKAGGIKLQYSRNSFKSDIFNEIKHLSPIEQEKILSKFGLSKNSENILSGLPVEISSNSLNDVEQAINNHIHKFLSKENKIVLPKGFEELHPVIESICNAIPEFRFTIQAQQHNVQKYNLAEHMLKAFQENMKNPMYKELSETDKRILGIATLLHDINKIERTKFDQHALPSSQTVNAIVERIPNLTPMEKNRIVNLVKYHHWLTDISEKENPTLVKNLTEVFRGGNDFKLARIFAESDLKAVNDSFYTNYGEKLNYSMINEIEEAILALQSKSRMMFTASVNTERALEKGAKFTTIGEGREATSNIVIDANKMGLDKEFFAYHGATEQGLMTVFASGGYNKGLGLSISTGKNGACKVFQDYEVFAIFDKLDMNAIGSISANNANTKYGKSDNRILSYMSRNSGFVTKFREYYPHQITDREYALVFREIQGLELSEVSKNKNIIKILGDTNKALDFEKALEGTNQFFASSEEQHNELVAFDLYPTAVGIKCKLENLSFEFRKFLQDNNIVIINNIK